MKEVIAYFESLEERLAAQEGRIAAQEERITAKESRITGLEKELTELKARLEFLESLEIPDETEEQEVEESVEEEKVEEKTVEEKLTKEEPAIEPEPVIEFELDPTPMHEYKPEEEKVSPNAALYGKAVSDIRQAISLGDRFLYQRELFGQNAELMQRTLTELDQLNSYEDALNYINQHFHWDTESNTYQQFLITLHRRFG